jgi:hypothetical protein
LRWKLRHRIKNYRENKTISELTNRLAEEKRFSRTEIANEFLRESNSFAMDWGESLSNDRDAIQFEKDNRQGFKTSEPMILDVLKSNYKDQIKEASPKADSSDKMKDELKKAVQERELSRQQLTLKDDIENDEVVHAKSEVVVPKQPTKENHKEI